MSGLPSHRQDPEDTEALILELRKARVAVLGVAPAPLPTTHSHISFFTYRN
jgi:hypothetical protein